MHDIDWNSLRRKAIDAVAGAYAPYSRFPVGAAALAGDGRVVTEIGRASCRERV